MAGMLLRKYLFRLIRQTGAELLVLILGIRFRTSRLRNICASYNWYGAGAQRKQSSSVWAAAHGLWVNRCIPITGTRMRVTLPDRGM